MELDDGVTVLHGDNGQGKTNLLEGIHVLATGGGARPGGAEAMVRHGAEAAWVAGRADKGVLGEAIRRVGLLAQNQIPVRLHLSPEGVVLSAQNHDVGEAREEMGPDVRYEGEEMTVAFNQRYLVDGLESAPGGVVALEVIEPHKPAVIRSAQDAGEFLYLLMPVRI